MENYNNAMKYAETAANSSGTAAEKYNNAYLDSIEAKTSALKASWEELSRNFLDSDIIKGIVDGLKMFVEVLNAVTSVANGAIPKVAALLGIFSAFQKSFNVWGKNLKAYIELLIETIPAKLRQLRSKVIKEAEAAKKELSASISTSLPVVIITLIITLLTTLEGRSQAVVATVVGGVVFLGTIIAGVIMGIKGSLTAFFEENPVGWIMTLVAAVAALAIGIVKLTKLKEEERKAAIENAEALQDEVDALKDVSDAAKDAKDSISDLVDEIKELNSSMTNADWYHYLEDLGGSIGDLYGDEGLSPLQAINELLGKNYTYSELIQMSEEKRLELLDEIAKKSAEELKIQQKKTYEAQKTASEAMIKAQGQSMKINTSGNIGKDEVKEFLKEMGGENIGYEYGSNHTILVGELNAETASEFVEKVQSVIDKYEEKYQYNLSSLSDNEIYQRFSEMLEAGNVALKNQTEAALDYLDTVSQIAGLSIDVDLNTTNVEGEFERVLNDILAQVKKDNTISTAITQGVLNASQIAEYAESYIANNFEELYNKTHATVVSLRGMVNMLGEVEEQYDTLADAIDEMTESGILSADTIKAMKSEFPELEEYLEKTAEGYKLSENALSAYMGKLSKEYADDITSAQKYFNSVYEAYESLPDSAKTVEEYEKVIEAQNSLKNAIENAEDWRRTEMTFGRSKLIEQYTDILEKQSDALDEQCDKYKDLCDIRKDLLETYQEEINAKKELKEKQQSVADLQTQLSLARLDNSASGQARVRELEAELKEAQEELDDYTLEQAIENICAEIDDTSSEYESFINEQIESIDEQVENIKTLLSEDIIKAIKESGESPVVGNSEDSDESMSSIGEGYQAIIQDAKSTAENSSITQPKTVEEAETSVKSESRTSGKLTSGVTLGKGLAGLSEGNPRETDDVDVIIGGKNFDLNAGKTVSGDIVKRLEEVNGGKGKAGDVVAYDGNLYIFDYGGDWRKMKDDQDRASEAAAAYLALLNKESTRWTSYKDAVAAGYSNIKTQNEFSRNSNDKAKYGTYQSYLDAMYQLYMGKLPIYHTGGLVSDVAALESNEVFAKLMKGEFVSTPAQMDRFIKETLPTIASYGGGAVINYNSPIVEIQCGTISEDTLPNLRMLVDEAAEKIKKDMVGALNRTGYRKKY